MFNNLIAPKTHKNLRDPEPKQEYETKPEGQPVE